MFKRNEDHNIILSSDSYKISHAVQYPPGSEKVYSYFESRGGEFDETVFFGLQYYLKRYLEGTVITKEKIEEARQLCKAHMGNEKLFNLEGWNYILEKHNGKLPIVIKAVPEGTVVPIRNVLMTVENTDPNCFWLTNYLETMLCQIWYPITVCSLSYNVKKVIRQHLERSGDPNLLDFKFHDFGYRGVSSQESAALGGAAHLVNFKGTDTLAALMLLSEYYEAPCSGFSIPATEHSTITSWGREHELDAFRNVLEQYPDGLVACVSDSYNIWEACEKLWGTYLKNEVMKRNGTLVIRPDSGKPTVVVMKVLDILGEKFGFTTNSKGYKVLDPHVRIIQGDGVDLQEVGKILGIMNDEGWSADNIAFGCGGGLLQKVNRDTQKFAFKCSNITVNGEERDVYKDPITDIGKRSKIGRLVLTKIGETYTTSNTGSDELVEVFRDGEIKKKYHLNKIRERASVLF